MPSLSKLLSAMRESELKDLCKQESLDPTNKSTVDLRLLLTKHFKENTDRFKLISNISIKVDAITDPGPLSPNISTQSQNTDSFMLADAFSKLAKSIEDKPSTMNTIVPVLESMHHRKVSFSGNEGENVHEFLVLFNEVCSLYNSDDSAKCKILTEIVTGQCAIVLKANKSSLKSFSDMSKLLITVFGKVSSDISNKLNLFQRSQVFSELFDVYISSLRLLNLKLISPLDENSLFELALQNAHPSMQEVLFYGQPTDMTSLLACARAYEARRAKKSNYVPPPKSLVPQQLSTQPSTSGTRPKPHYKSVSFQPRIHSVDKSSSSSSEAEENIEVNFLKKEEKKTNQKPNNRNEQKVKTFKSVSTQTQSSQADLSTVTCYRCHQLGHIAPRCPQLENNKTAEN